MNQSRKLGITQWAALEEAEKLLYHDHMGVSAFTDVNVNEGHELLHFMWEHAEDHLDISWGLKTEEEKEAKVAKRVANALAVLTFGIEGDLVDAI